jgi:hypothetical protein
LQAPLDAASVIKAVADEVRRANQRERAGSAKRSRKRTAKK